MKILLALVMRYIENNPEKVQELLHALIDKWIADLQAQKAATDAARS